MENMQDILKKYYASGGKDLFKEKLTEIDDTDSSGLKLNATRPKRKVDPVDMRAVTYYMDDAPFDTFQDGPTFSIEAEKEQLAPFLDNIKQRWEQDYGYDMEDELDETDGQLGEIDDWEFPFTENTAYSWQEVEEGFGELYDNMEADNEQKEKSE